MNTSRLTKKPILLPKDVSATAASDVLTVKGPKGELRVRVAQGTEVRIEGGNLWINSGTTWALARNAVEGVAQGFVKVLEIEGVGYRAAAEGKELVLFIGYANPVRMKVPEGVALTVDKNLITLAGIDKDLVGRTAAEIRAMKKPEPYKGKGIHYRGEVIRRKVGKKAGAAGGAA